MVLEVENEFRFGLSKMNGLQPHQNKNNKGDYRNNKEAQSHCIDGLEA
jgi:hypothetical protein